MPKFYRAKGHIEPSQLDTLTIPPCETTLARGSIGDLKLAIREQPPGIFWETEIFDFPFTKDAVCAFIEGKQKPIGVLKLRLNDAGQVRDLTK